jgi:hypothetical protein
MPLTLHIDTRLEKEDVRLLVEKITGGRLAHGTVTTSWGEAGVGDDLRSSETSTGHPDDFLNWPYYIDTYSRDGVSEEEFLKGIYDLRNGLVQHGVRVWIVTDLEYDFPKGWTPDN